MKKVIILAIVLIFLASIVIVNFFGLEIAIFDGTTYVDSIELQRISVYRQDGTEEEAQYKGFYPGTSEPYFVIDFIPSADGTPYTPENIAENENQVILTRMVLPTNANNKSVEMVYDSDYADNVAVFMEKMNTIIFLKPNKLMHITLRAGDGSNKSTSFYIMAKEQKAK